jgi:hypothetical protein
MTREPLLTRDDRMAITFTLIGCVGGALLVLAIQWAGAI